MRGRLYVVGGWGTDGNPIPSVEIYDPASNSATTGATAPGALAASGGALLGWVAVTADAASANVLPTTRYIREAEAVDQ